MWTVYFVVSENIHADGIPSHNITYIIPNYIMKHAYILVCIVPVLCIESSTCNVVMSTMYA